MKGSATLQEAISLRALLNRARGPCQAPVLWLGGCLDCPRSTWCDSAAWQTPLQQTRINMNHIRMCVARNTPNLLGTLSENLLARPVALWWVSPFRGWSQAALGHLRALLHMGVPLPAGDALEAAVRPTNDASTGDPVCLPWKAGCQSPHMRHALDVLSPLKWGVAQLQQVNDAPCATIMVCLMARRWGLAGAFVAQLPPRKLSGGRSAHRKGGVGTAGFGLNAQGCGLYCRHWVAWRAWCGRQPTARPCWRA